MDLEDRLKLPQSPGIRDRDGWPATHFAARRGHTMCVGLLLEAAYDIEATAAAAGSTALHCAANFGQVRTLRLVLDAGADTSSRMESEGTALHCAAAGGHWRSARLLLNAGVEMYSRDTNGKTALHFAAEGGHLEVVQEKPLQRSF